MSSNARCGNRPGRAKQRVRQERRRWTSCARVRGGRETGFTIVELLGILTVVGILTAIGVTSTRGALDRGRNAQAIAEIMSLGLQIQEYRATYDSLPASLAGINRAGTKDPWGRAYVYGRTADLVGKVRKDRFLNPLNSDFDLYSKGPDGESVGPLTDSRSFDDILRANDGGYVGLGAEY